MLGVVLARRANAGHVCIVLALCRSSQNASVASGGQDIINLREAASFHRRMVWLVDYFAS
jgi:hypothetical protein